MANDYGSQAQTAAATGEGNVRPAAESLLQKGLDHYDRQELDAALACYQQAVSSDPTFALGYNNLGTTWMPPPRTRSSCSLNRRSKKGRASGNGSNR
ncbi:MAG: tetratricopeptide repeat protein [Planctomycetes bacterium]|nr:tetratricopeptide repeat protein [Planctomycetota bacterium]